MTKIQMVGEGTKGQILSYMQMYGYLWATGGAYRTHKGLVKDLEDNLEELRKDGHKIDLVRVKQMCFIDPTRKVKIPKFRLKYVYAPTVKVLSGC